MRLLAIVNPHAGGGKGLNRLKDWQTLHAGSPHEFQWEVTESAAEMQERIQNSPRDGFTGIVLAGGDGTLHEALPALQDAGLPFGLIPCGRGNDFARNVSLSHAPRANRFMDPRPELRRIDLATVNGTPFGSIACLGFDAKVNRLAKDGRGYFQGALGYLICVFKALPDLRPFPVEVSIGNQTWSGEIVMMAVANGPYYGGGMKISPAARMDDGVLNVCIVETLPRRKLLWNLSKVFRGTHIQHPQVRLFAASEVKMTCEGVQEIFADGEFAGETPAVWKVESRSLALMLPTRIL
jgi:diacylglycerol kinase (ATP)